MEKETIYHAGVEHQQYETELKGKRYKLDLYPQNYLYQLTLPTGKTVEGSIPSLVRSIKYNHRQPSLNAWLLKSINWKTLKGSKEDQKTIKFTVNCRKYSMTFNSTTGEINLHFPRMIIVAARKDLASQKNFPEIHAVLQGSLTGLLASIIADSGVDTERNTEPLELQLFSNDMKHYSILGWEIGVEYNANTDVLFLDLPPRTVYSHLFALPLDALEFEILNDGKYKDAVFQILVDHGMKME